VHVATRSKLSDKSAEIDMHNNPFLARPQIIIIIIIIMLWLISPLDTMHVSLWRSVAGRGPRGASGK
jgi:hypothetical protein